MSKKRTLLQEHFPMIRSREEVLAQICAVPSLNAQFRQWNPDRQELFLDFCSGAKGVKVVYDGIFKEIFNPEVHPERLEAILSLLLNRKVRIEKVLPNDSVRLGGESSLLYTDIIVELEDGSLSDVEIQKIGYQFPGERSACYSSDHLLRQYKRVRGEKGKYFTYRDIKKVYTIVFFEHATKPFLAFPQNYIHRFRQTSDTGVEVNLLQEYIYITLDIFKRSRENRSITSELDAWLAFLSFDDPEWILALVNQYPRFRVMYEDIYNICLNMEKVMTMYSKELALLDTNTAHYMMDEMQEELDRMRVETEQLQAEQERLQAETERLQEERKQMQAETERLQGEKKQLQVEQEQFQAETEQLQEERKQLQAELEQLRVEMEAKDQRLEELLKRQSN